MNYLLLLNLEIKLNNYLNDILEYSESACNYLENPYCELDKEEIIMYLNTVPECIQIVKDLVQKIEEEYEKEKRNDCEQL